MDYSDCWRPIQKCLMIQAWTDRIRTGDLDYVENDKEAKRSEIATYRTKQNVSRGTAMQDQV